MLELTDNSFNEIADIMKKLYGINLNGKKTLIEGRLNGYLMQNDFTSYDTFIKSLKNDKSGEILTNVINRLTTNHTFFMREADHFELFKNEVLPFIMKSAKECDMRIWSAGCSTGEEPYTLALLIKEFLGFDSNKWDHKILATDISEKALEKAQRGIYQLSDLESIPYSYKKKYFKAINEREMEVVSDLRKSVIFRKFNLMEEVFPFRKKFHTIFCRNVMIYFDGITKSKLVRKFYDCIEEGGYFFIGHSEALKKGECGFKTIEPAVYRK